MLWLPGTLSSAQAELPPAATERKNKVIYSECLHATEPTGLVASPWGTGGDLEALVGLGTPPGWGNPAKRDAQLSMRDAVVHTMEFRGEKGA